MKLERGPITRLIDVTLIILIGFLAIADLGERTSLELPREVNAMLDTLQLDQRRLSLHGSADGAYHMELVSASGLRRPLGMVQGADTLQAVLGRLKEEHGLGGVDIEIEGRAIVQYAVDAVDACDLHEIPREIRFLDESGAAQ
jgi:biopolymer transport protein ExbD